MPHNKIYNNLKVIKVENISKFVLFAWLCSFSTQVYSQATRRDSYRDLNFLAKGNAGLAHVSDGRSVFYNPAGLARLDSVRLQFVEVGLGGNQNLKDSYAGVMGIMDEGESLATKMNPFLGLPLSLQGNFLPHLAMPHFMVGGFGAFDTYLEYRDPVNPVLTTDLRADYGIVLGVAQGWFDRVYLGAALKFTRRRHILREITAVSLLEDAGRLMSLLQNKGEGWGLNVGAQFRHPIGSMQELMVGVAIEDLGDTQFRTHRANDVPRPQGQLVNVGTTYSVRSLLVDTHFSFDIRNAFLDPTNGSYTKKIHMGAEVILPGFDLRAGLFQGYWTAGLSFRLMPLLTLDLSSYGEELGFSAGQRSNRFYLIGFRMGMDLKPGKQGKSKQRFTLDNL